MSYKINASTDIPKNLGTLVVRNDGTLWTWGYNQYGQLGQGDLIHRSSPVQIGTDTDWLYANKKYDFNAFAIKKDGTLWSWGYNDSGNLGQGINAHRSSPVQIGTSQDTWIEVDSNENNAIAIMSDGTIWAW